MDWSIINKLKKEGSFASLALAVLESDKLLFEELSKQGVKGENLREKIRNTRDRFTHLRGLLEARKIKEKIIKDKINNLDSGDFEYALKNYKKAINDISGFSDYQRPNLIILLWNKIVYQFSERPLNLIKPFLYFIFFIFLLFIIDNTDLGQRIIHFISVNIFWIFSLLFVFFFIFGILYILNKTKETGK